MKGSYHRKGREERKECAKALLWQSFALAFALLASFAVENVFRNRN